MSDKANPLIPIKNIPESTWKKLSEKKIYFGHQSVGFNIIKGGRRYSERESTDKIHSEMQKVLSDEVEFVQKILPVLDNYLP